MRPELALYEVTPEQPYRFWLRSFFVNALEVNSFTPSYLDITCMPPLDVKVEEGLYSVLICKPDKPTGFTIALCPQVYAVQHSLVLFLQPYVVEMKIDPRVYGVALHLDTYPSMRQARALLPEGVK